MDIKKFIDEKIEVEKNFNTIDVRKNNDDIANEIRARKKTILHLNNIKKELKINN